MSSYTNIYVEYKDDRDNLWHLLKAYVPLEDRTYERNESEEELSDVTIKLEEKSYFISNSISKCGIIRDLLTESGKKFFNRGFPEDISADLENIFNKQQEEIDSLNEKSSNELSAINHDWRYAKSWCYLSELREEVEKLYGSYTRCAFNSELDKIYKKLSNLCDKLSPSSISEKETEEYDECDEDEYADELEDVIYARGFCDFIEGLIDFITGSISIHEGNVRLVYYTE